MSARDEVLSRIAAAHRAAPPPTLAYDDIDRSYATTSDHSHDELTELLIDRLVDYKALVRRCSRGDLAGTVAAALAERHAGTVVVPAGVDHSWLEQASATIRTDGPNPDEQLSVTDLEDVDGVITTCATAVAETGTLVLDGSGGMGRRVVTLIPDYHLCIVLPDQVCADIPQALDRLDATRPLTMISGPSATSDIELNRVEGVHGPRTLDVVIVR